MAKGSTYEYTAAQVLSRAFDEDNNYLSVTQDTRIAGEDLTNDVLKTEDRFSALNITTNATTTVKSGSGLLHRIIFNNPMDLTVTKLTLTIYDNTAASGTKIATMTVPFGATTALPFSIEMNVAFTTGLTIVTAGPTVTADITVSYR